MKIIETIKSIYILSSAQERAKPNPSSNLSNPFSTRYQKNSYIMYTQWRPTIKRASFRPWPFLEAYNVWWKPDDDSKHDAVDYGRGHKFVRRVTSLLIRVWFDDTPHSSHPVAERGSYCCRKKMVLVFRVAWKRGRLRRKMRRKCAFEYTKESNVHFVNCWY